MADKAEKTEKTESKPEGGDGAAKPKGKGKLFIMIGGLLVVEAVAIIGASMLLGGPDHTEASVLEIDPLVAEQEKIVELKVLDSRFPNQKSGVTMVYQTEVYVQSRAKHSEAVKAELEQFAVELRAEIAAIWKTAEPQDFQEPKLETLTRRVEAMLQERFGNDTTDGTPRITKCIVVMGSGFRMDP